MYKKFHWCQGFPVTDNLRTCRVYAADTLDLHRLMVFRIPIRACIQAVETDLIFVDLGKVKLRSVAHNYREVSLTQYRLYSHRWRGRTAVVCDIFKMAEVNNFFAGF